MMKYTAIHRKIATLICFSLVISACNWVDSTGRQSNTKPTIILDDGSPDDGFSVIINEEASTSIDPSASSDDDGTIVSWTWDQSPVSAGALDVCSGVDGFMSTYAANSLEEACSVPDQCQFKVVTEEVDKTEEEMAEDQLLAEQSGSTVPVSETKTIFTINTPKLKAPIGLTYRITAIDNDGGTGFAEVSFCLIAINEAPEAVDDAFTVIEGTEKLVAASDPINLLSNDSDDIDVTNQPLSVLTTPVESPQLADSFNLQSDGGFSYFYQGDPSRPAGEEFSDSFAYELTDGLHSVQANVDLRIVTVDDPPILTSQIPDQTAIAGIAFRFDFTRFFRDPENASLVYSETTGNLPASFSRDELSKGRLAGTPSGEEVDQYTIALAASDGNNTTQDDLVLTILGNKPPTISAIADQSGTIGKSFSLDLSRYAKDPENQPLSYSISGHPNFLRLNGSKITGTPNTDGSWTIRVTVRDGFNNPVSRSFKFTVVNKAPVASKIPDQAGFVNQAFSFNVARYFSDPEGQKLTYSLSGNGSSFLSINKNSGLISGTPKSVGNFNVRVVASDGQKSVGSSFVLKVSNPPPVVKSPIPDKTYTTGQAITFNIAGFFSDPNGDKLSFTASGLPPSGAVRISNAGVISGSPVISDAGVYNVKVTASDGNGSVSDTFKMTILKENSPPKLDKSGNGGTVDKGANVSFVSRFSDPDAGDSLTFTVDLGGSGLSSGSSGNNVTVSGKANKVGTFTIKVTAKDQSGTTVQDSYKLKVNAVNSPPTVASSGGGGTVDKGTNVSFVSKFSDPDAGDSLTFSVDLGGSGLSSGSSGNNVTVSGKANKVGTFTIKVTAKDQSNATVSDTYTLKVNAVNSPPTVTSSGGGGTVDQGTAVSFVSKFSDPDAGDSLTFTVDLDGSGLSSGSSGNNVTVSGNANNAGTFTIKVTAKDQSNATVTDSYTLKVNVVTANTPPKRIQKANSKTVNLGEPTGNFVSKFSDPDPQDASLNFNIDKDGANFLTLTSSGKTATVNGTATILGEFDIVVTAVDHKGASAEDKYTLKVE